MAFCTNCGAEVRGPFCGNCGAPAPAASGPTPAASGVPGVGTPAVPPPPPPPPPLSAPPASVPVAAAKTSPLVWIVGGCGGLIVLAAIVGGLSMYYIAHKAHQLGDLAKRNPALAAVKLMVAMNPAIDVVSVDEDKGMITLREKQTGKTVTMNLEEAQKGKFVFSAPGEKPVTIEAHGDGATGSLELKSDQGSLKMGAGAGDKLPSWVPNYPGSDPQANFSVRTDKEQNGTFGFTTKDSIEQVVKHYEDALKSAGLTVNSNIIQSNGKASVGIVTAEETGGKRKMMVNATLSDQGTTVGVTFSAQP